MDGSLRQCPKCVKVKPASEYWKSKSTKHGLQIYCRECQRAIASQYDKGKHRERIARWHRSSNGKKYRHKQRLNSFGITVEQYDAMVLEQSGRCAVCRSNERLDIDHCHETGIVRGLLCRPCNLALGKMREDPIAILALADYAIETQARKTA